MMFIGQVYVESGKAFMFSTPLKSEYSTVKGLIKKINFLIAASGSDYEVASGDVFDQSTEVTLQKSDNVMLMYFGYNKAA